jgi:hypothetical protein
VSLYRLYPANPNPIYAYGVRNDNVGTIPLYGPIVPFGESIFIGNHAQPTELEAVTNVVNSKLQQVKGIGGYIITTGRLYHPLNESYRQSASRGIYLNNPGSYNSGASILTFSGPNSPIDVLSSGVI